LVLNLLWQSKRCSGTAEDYFSLDRAFSLIERHPAALVEVERLTEFGSAASVC
jgi:hypothetical protein